MADVGKGVRTRTHPYNRLKQTLTGNLLPGLVFVVALALRLGFATYVHPVPSTDFAWYHNQALDILQGQGYRFQGRPTAYFPVGYPLFLAGVYGVFGVGLQIGIVVNSLLNSATAAAVAVLGRRLYGPRVGLVSGLAMALYLPHIEWSVVLDSEMLFSLLFVLTLLLWVRAQTAHKPMRWYALSGLVIGLSCWVRPITLLLPGVLLLARWLSGSGFWRGVRQALLVTACMALTVAPLTVRNAYALHSFVPVSTNGGVNLWQGNNPQANGAYYWPLNSKENPFLNYAAHEVTDNRLATQMAERYILHHPGRTWQMGWVKLGNLFRGVDNPLFWSLGQSRPPVSPTFATEIGRLTLGEYRLAMTFAVLGLAAQIVDLSRRRDLKVLVLWLTVLYYLALFFIFPAWSRMRAPLEPLLLVFTGTGVVALLTPWHFFRRRTDPQGVDRSRTMTHTERGK